MAAVGDDGRGLIELQRTDHRLLDIRRGPGTIEVHEDKQGRTWGDQFSGLHQTRGDHTGGAGRDGGLRHVGSDGGDRCVNRGEPRPSGLDLLAPGAGFEAGHLGACSRHPFTHRVDTRCRRASPRLGIIPGFCRTGALLHQPRESCEFDLGCVEFRLRKGQVGFGRRRLCQSLINVLGTAPGEQQPQLCVRLRSFRREAAELQIRVGGGQRHQHLAGRDPLPFTNRHRQHAAGHLRRHPHVCGLNVTGRPWWAFHRGAAARGCGDGKCGDEQDNADHAGLR